MNFTNKLKWIRKRISWNYKYAIGKWDYMGKESERYLTIANFIKDTNLKNIKILDLGCGYGTLYEFLDEDDILEYIGVDLSDTAIIIAKKKKYKKAKFIVADIQNIEIEKKFDIIIFNEVLYYLDNPLLNVIKFQKNFITKGNYIFSFYGERDDLKIELEKYYKLLESKIIKKDSKSNWGINLFEYNNNKIIN